MKEAFHISFGREKVEIDSRVFSALLVSPHVRQLKKYKDAIETKKIAISDLKDLASRASTPLPLFFAPLEKVKIQILDELKTLSEKIPAKKTMSVGLRGNIDADNFDLIFKDLSRKQGYLKRIIPTEVDCAFIGSVMKMSKEGSSVEAMAEYVRGYFGVGLEEMRKMAKSRVLAYLCRKIESRGILVSFSSHNYMPQNIPRTSRVSGVCVKDKKFPYIFINTRDGDEKPLILETDGRQIFTLVHMIVCIGMALFVLNTATKKMKKGPYKKAFEIAAEMLVPSLDLIGVEVNTLDDIRDYARIFKVTPSMMVMRLRDEGKITALAARGYWEVLRSESNSVAPKQKRSATPITGYKKYNGERFSREVLTAYKKKRIPFEEAANVLFRKGKMKNDLFSEYQSEFGIV